MSFCLLILSFLLSYWLLQIHGKNNWKSCHMLSSVTPETVPVAMSQNSFVVCDCKCDCAGDHWIRVTIGSRREIKTTDVQLQSVLPAPKFSPGYVTHAQTHTLSSLS